MTALLTTVSEFIDDMSSCGDVEIKNVNIGTNDMVRHTIRFRGHTVSAITNMDQFHSIVVKRKDDDITNAYVYYDINASIHDLYNQYADLLDMQNYEDGFLCIHEQHEKFQNDYLNDIIERVYSLYRNEPFPDTVPVFFDLEDDLRETLTQMADDLNIPLDEMIQRIIMSELEKLIEEGKPE